MSSNYDVSDNCAICEYRITLPMSLEEFRIGHLYTTAEMSKDQCGGREGVELLTQNEPFDMSSYGEKPIRIPSGLKTNGDIGRKTDKIYVLRSKIPPNLKFITRNDDYLELREKSWNLFPFVRTEISHEGVLKENCFVLIDSYYTEDDGLENVHELKGQELSDRVIEKLDVANDPVNPEDYKPEYDPCLVGSAKTGRAPLPKDGTGDWMKNVKPRMTCYRLVRLKFKWWGQQDRIQNIMSRECKRIFLNYYRRLVCSVDQFCGLTMDDVMAHEAKSKSEFENLSRDRELRGMFFK